MSDEMSAPFPKFANTRNCLTELKTTLDPAFSRIFARSAACEVSPEPQKVTTEISVPGSLIDVKSFTENVTLNPLSANELVVQLALIQEVPSAKGITFGLEKVATAR